MGRFINNKYRRWYKAIIAGARGRDLYGHCEKHHVLPKSLGGSNRAMNTVKLTYREHFLAHWLLVKFTRSKDCVKMNFAMYRMTYNPRGLRIISSWQYAVARKAHTTALKKREFSEEHRRKISISAKNRVPVTGWHHTDEARKKMSVNRPKGIKTTGFTGRSHTKESKAKTSKTMLETLSKMDDTSDWGWARYTKDPEHQRRASLARWNKK